MPQREDLADRLTQEWREMVISRLSGQDDALKLMQKDIGEIKMNTSSTAMTQRLEERVRVLENFQLRAITIVACIQGVIAVLWALLSKVVFK